MPVFCHDLLLLLLHVTGKETGKEKDAGTRFPNQVSEGETVERTSFLSPVHAISGDKYGAGREKSRNTARNMGRESVSERRTRQAQATHERTRDNVCSHRKERRVLDKDSCRAGHGQTERRAHLKEWTGHAGRTLGIVYATDTCSAIGKGDGSRG